MIVQIPPGIRLDYTGSHYVVSFEFMGVKHIRFCQDVPPQQVVRDMATFRQILIDKEWARIKERWRQVLAPISRPVARVLAWFGGKGAA